MENGKILDSQIAASSHWNDQRDLTTARLKLKQTGMGAWSAGKNDVNQWIQVDFKNKAIVTNILTQGTNSTTFYQWVKSYTVYYSNGRIDVAPYKKGGEVKVI